MKSENMSMNFLCSFILNSIVLLSISMPKNLLLMHDFVNIMHSSFRKYWFMELADISNTALHHVTQKCYIFYLKYNM